MESPAVSKQAFVLPKLRYKFKTPIESDRFSFFDVKFYPYLPPPADEPVFAVATQKKVLVGRVSTQSSALVTMLHELVDEEETQDESSPGLNSCSWCYIDQRRPLLAVAGGSGAVKLIDAVEGRRLSTLVGHGHGTINDIATHPLHPWIIATASMDKSLRIWDIRRHAHPSESTTVIICGQGRGHCEGVLTVSWHSSGRYLVTGGHDQRICVWTIPDLADGSSFWREISPEHGKRSSNDVMTIHFPHFISSSVHSNFVDCARFFGDLIFSKAAGENKIVLWKITGFDSRQPPPDSRTAPKIEDYMDTRNGFMRTITDHGDGDVDVDVAEEFASQPLYKRLLEFETPIVDQFYLRFGLLMPSPAFPNLHPVLAFANAGSEIRFWDLERLSLGHAGGLDDSRLRPVAKKKRKGLAVPVKKNSGRLNHALNSQTWRDVESPMSSASNISSGAGHHPSSPDATSDISESTTHAPFPVRDRDRYPIHDAHRPLKPHAKISLTDMQFKGTAALFCSRATEWSPCGKWCITVGESTKDGQGIGGFAVMSR